MQIYEIHLLFLAIKNALEYLSNSSNSIFPIIVSVALILFAPFTIEITFDILMF